MLARRYVITGQVQGVFFRASAKEQADALGIRGWIRNRRDGSVEAHAQGTPEELRHFELWLQRGPPDATVTAVDVRETEMMDAPSFEIEADE